ncbi:hypothetical protein ACSZMF_21460 [Aeromonas caviae]|uniref:hypothetical protein n=1 Tax=Aeromonas caviae TaxID=648 RepID=UPI003EC5BCEF
MQDANGVEHLYKDINITSLCEQERLKLYKSGKALLYDAGLTPKEYERSVRKLADKLGV